MCSSPTTASPNAWWKSGTSLAPRGHGCCARCPGGATCWRPR
jgi:hypothetical protein